MARRAEKRGRWKISKHEFYTAMHYAYQYNEWRKEYDALLDTSKAILYDDMPHAANTRDLTADAAEKREELSRKMHIVEQTALEAEPTIYEYLLKAVTNEGVTYEYLRTMCKIPCGKDMFYDRRRKFYYLLSKQI